MLAETTDCQGYAKNAPAGNITSNSRDGGYKMKVKGKRCAQLEIIYEEVFSTIDADLDSFLSRFFKKVWEAFTLSGLWDQVLK